MINTLCEDSHSGPDTNHWENNLHPSASLLPLSLRILTKHNQGILRGFITAGKTNRSTCLNTRCCVVVRPYASGRPITVKSAAILEMGTLYGVMKTSRASRWRSPRYSRGNNGNPASVSLSRRRGVMPRSCIQMGR